MNCANEPLEKTGTKTRVLTKVAINKIPPTVRHLDSPDALQLTSKKSFDITTILFTLNQADLDKSEKSKRDSPQTHNVREKLLQYAYKDKRTKN